MTKFNELPVYRSLWDANNNIICDHNHNVWLRSHIKANYGYGNLCIDVNNIDDKLLLERGNSITIPRDYWAYPSLFDAAIVQRVVLSSLGLLIGT